MNGVDRLLVCTHATFRLAVDELGIAAFDDRLLAIDEFRQVSSNTDNKLGTQLAALIARDKVSGADVARNVGNHVCGPQLVSSPMCTTCTTRPMQQVRGMRD